MAKFKKGDIVTTLKDNEETMEGKCLGAEAVVDFQDGDNVYISEWGKNLNNPIRYIVPAHILYIKDKGKITITVDEINALMSSALHIQNADFNHEPSLEDMKVGDTFYNDSSKYTYVGELDGQIVWDREGYFCVIDESDIQKLFRTQDSVCKQLFNLSKDQVNII